jgi:hypothetical protein
MISGPRWAPYPQKREGKWNIIVEDLNAVLDFAEKSQRFQGRDTERAVHNQLHERGLY